MTAIVLVGVMADRPGGLALLCLLRTPLRWIGAALIVIAGLWAVRAPLPDILIASDGHGVAVRGADGRLTVHRSARDAFAVREWLAADADPRTAADKSLGEGFRCDASACIASLAGGGLVSHVLAPDAFEENCTRATIVVTARAVPPGCKAHVIDWDVSRARGAVTLRRAGTVLR
jgi:competence protein ComEC